MTALGVRISWTKSAKTFRFSVRFIVTLSWMVLFTMYRQRHFGVHVTSDSNCDDIELINNTFM